MAPEAPKSLAELLGRGRLAALGAEARRRRDLTEEVRARLPREAAGHLVTAGIGPAGELVLTMDASAWAARVRFLAEEIGAGGGIRVKVQPGAGPGAEPR